MKENDNLPNIIAGTALLAYLVFLFFMARPSKDVPLEGGNIQHAIETNQYK